jgi:hypothetical protein
MGFNAVLQSLEGGRLSKENIKFVKSLSVEIFIHLFKREKTSKAHIAHKS